MKLKELLENSEEIKRQYIHCDIEDPCQSCIYRRQLPHNNYAWCLNENCNEYKEMKAQIDAYNKGFDRAISLLQNIETK